MNADIEAPLPISFGERMRAMLRAYATPRAPLGEVSVADPNTFYGQPIPYNPNELISTRGYETLDRMRKDDQVKAALAFKKNSVMASGWRIVAPEGQEDDWEPKVEVERQLWRIEGGFQRAAREMMSALDYGFSLSEKVWHEDEGKIRLHKLATRKPHDIYLNTDDGGNLTTIEQNGKELNPIEKFVLYTYDYEFSNPYGRTDLEAAYRAWWTKSNSYRWMAMLLERMGIPPVFALYDSGKYSKAQQSKLYDVIESMQAATVATIPRPEKDALELWSPELAGQVSTVFKPAMDMFNQDISRALLMPGLLGMTADEAQGSFARASVHFDVFMLVLESIRTETQDIINKQIVDDMLLWNFGDISEEEKPYFEWLPITEDAREAILTQWTSMVNSEVVTRQSSDEAHVRELLKFPEIDENDASIRATRFMPVQPEEGEPDVEQPTDEMPEEPIAEPMPVDEVAAGKDVQDLALNGAQITAVVAIVQNVSDGLLPPESAIQLLLISFPTIDEATARALIMPAAQKATEQPPPQTEPQTPPTPPNAQPQQREQEPVEDEDELETDDDDEEFRRIWKVAEQQGKRKTLTTGQFNVMLERFTR